MSFLRDSWWKILALCLLVYGIIAGLLLEVPVLPVVRESIRNVYFHVGMWFSMMFILALSLFYSMRYLRNFRQEDDLKAAVAVKTGLLFGFLGLATGMIWAWNTWGRVWINDPKLNGAAVGVLAYMAYMLLRNSVESADKRARLAAVYNIFAFVIFFVFIMILPRLAGSSIHPGVGGNPALNPGDMDLMMQRVFVPVIAGWILLSLWIFKVYARLQSLGKNIVEYRENNF